MDIKEKLIKDREQANTALLAIKQKYSPLNDRLFFIVEGNDDVSYYKSISLRYETFSRSELVILPANNRKNVIHLLQEMDWNMYSKDRVFFFVDRDLTGFTGEYTPESSNLYVTDDYSIENSIFTKETFFTCIHCLTNSASLEHEEKEVVSKLYDDAFEEFCKIYLHIMGWILFWKRNGLGGNLNNLNNASIFQIKDGIVNILPLYRNIDDLYSSIHTQCGVTFVPKDISREIDEIIQKQEHIGQYIRGKYVRLFFVKYFDSIVASSDSLFPSKKKIKKVVQIGVGNAIQLVSGYSVTPRSLHAFLSSIKTPTSPR